MIQFRQSEFEDILHGMASNDKSAQDVAYEMIDETRDFHQEVVLTGSTVNNLSVNAFYWATRSLLGVAFDSNYSKVFGSMMHYGTEFLHKHKINTGKRPPLRDALLAMAKKGRKLYYGELPESAKDKSAKDYMPLKALYTEAKAFMHLYYEQVAPSASPVEVERRIKYPLAADDGMPLNILLSGQFDRRDRVKMHDVLSDMVVDLKTSKMNIYGEKVEDPELERLHEELQEASKKLTRDDKVKRLEENLRVAKRNPSKSELQKELEASIKAARKKVDAKRTPEEDRAEAQRLIDETDPKVAAEIERIERQHEVNLKAAEDALRHYQLQREQDQADRIEQLQKEIEPLQAKVDALQYENDCEAARKRYGKQLAFYALLIMLVDGIEVKYGRIELLLRQAVPKIRVFEFSIEKEVRELVKEIATIVELIELWRNGTPARLLFRPNRDTYIGQELMKIVDNMQVDEEDDQDESFQAAA
ncbi:hypothetical protein ACXWTF_12835 [Thiomicrolovo sp. ZZH C-3]